VLDDGVEVGDVPVTALVDGCPLYDLEAEQPDAWMYGNEETLGERVALSAGAAADPSDPSAILCALLSSSNVASKRWAFEQYDSVVGSRTVRRPEDADAAVLMVPESDRAIAVSIDGNGRRVACEPYAGAVEGVLECAQNLACVGAEPLGLTNCLNFGNPEKPNVAWQLDRAVAGLADACRGLGIPVVGGNVSLYNETEHGPIYPTPVVGMVGKLPDPERVPVSAFTEPGLAVALVGAFRPSLAGSELEKLRGALSDGLPSVDLAEQARTLAAVREAVRSGLVRTAHDVAEGGLAVALAEAAIAGRTGVRARIGGDDFDTACFGEGPGGVVVAFVPEAFDELAAICGDVPLVRIGETTDNTIVLEGSIATLTLKVEEAATAYEDALPSSFE
jgi:phosphoribosylformylglycinamidine synthase